MRKFGLAQQKLVSIPLYIVIRKVGRAPQPLVQIPLFKRYEKYWSGPKIISENTLLYSYEKGWSGPTIISANTFIYRYEQTWKMSELFISRFYPKVCELGPFQNRNKQLKLGANTMFKTLTSGSSYPVLVTFSRLAYLTQVE